MTFDVDAAKAEVRRLASLGYTPGGVSEDVQRHSIAVEKMLCAALGREWRPSGMSTETLCLDVADLVADTAK